MTSVQDKIIQVQHTTSGMFFENMRDICPEAIDFRIRDGRRAFAVYCDGCVVTHWTVWIDVNDTGHDER